MKIDFDDLIRQKEDIKALRYLAKELYKNNKIGGTRKRLLDRVAGGFEELEENEAYASLRAIELKKENEKLKQEIEHNRTPIEHNRTQIEHNEKLQEENKQLQQTVENLKYDLKYQLEYLVDVGIEKEHQYKEALRKCSPWLLTTNQCLICGGKNNHLDDCEYVRLTR